MQLATEAADQAIADQMIAPGSRRCWREYEAQGRTPGRICKADAGPDLVGKLDDEALREVLDRALSYAMLRGAATQAA